MKKSSKIFGFSVAILAIGLMSATASAQGRGEGKEGPGKKGAQEKGKRGFGKGAEGRGRGQQGRPQRGQQDPQEMVKRMIEEFDKNGDKALDAKELLAMFTQMRERAGGRGGRGGFGQGGDGARGQGRGGPGRGGPGRGPQKGGKGGAGGKGEDKAKGRPDFN